MEINGREWSKGAIQSLYLKLGDLSKLSLRLGISISKLRPLLLAEGVKSPTEYVKTLALSTPDKLKALILREGGLNAAALYLHVSLSFLRNLLRDTGFNWQEPRPSMGKGRLDLIRQYVQDPEKLKLLTI